MYTLYMWHTRRHYKMLLGHAITGLHNEFEVRNICTSVVPLSYFHHRDRLKRSYILT